MGRFDLGFGFGFDVLVDGRGNFVGFVDGSGFGFLLGESVALLEGGEFESIDAVEDAVEFVLEAVIGVEIESATEELVEGGVEILLSGFEVSGGVVVLARLVILFDASDEASDGIDFESLRNGGLGLGFGGGRGRGLERLRRLAGGDNRGSLRLRGRQERRFLRRLAGQGRRQRGSDQERRIRMRKRPHILKNLANPRSGEGYIVTSIVDYEMVLSQISLGQRHRRHLPPITSGTGWECYPTVAGDGKCGRRADEALRGVWVEWLRATSRGEARIHRK